MLYLCYLCQFKPLRDHLRGFLIAAWAGDKIAEFSFPEISFHFSLRPWFFFVSPAYAGKSPAAAYACPGTQDHPRVCGEKLYTPCVIAPSVGSPPRMREKARQQEHLAAQSGITPACAGKSIIEATSRALNEDHPRMCGEKGGVLRRAPQRPGSPPHVRGKVGLRLIAAQDDGITPACAGKSEPPGSGLGASGDHPRMCGEKTKPQRVAPPKLGSPPHVRGKVSQFVDGCACHGITPACAGKRGFRSNQPVYPRDHPRVCGEKRFNRDQTILTTGSPPRMRGKAVPTVPATFPIGITPAYAGKRLKRFRSTVSPVAIVPLFPSVCNKPVVSDGSPAGRDAPLFLPAENAVPASPAYNLRSL